MRLQSSYVIVLGLVLVFCIAMVTIPKSESSSTLNAQTIDQYLKDAGLPADVQIVKVNLGNPVSIDEPIIIMGSGIDAMENQVYQAVAANYQVESSYVLNDKTSQFKGKSIESYDIVVIGGPEHNAYTKALLGRGILKYNATSLKTPGLIVEAEKLPGGHTVLVVASVTGYPYQEKTSLDANNPEPSAGDVTPGPSDEAPIPLTDEGKAVWNELMRQRQKTEEALKQLPEEVPATMTTEEAGKFKTTAESMQESLKIEKELWEKLSGLLEKSKQQPGQGTNQQQTDEEISKLSNVYNQMFEAVTKMINEENDLAKQAIEASGR